MKKVFITILYILLALIVFAEPVEINLTLDEAIVRARARSVDAAVSLNELRQAYWEYRTFRADLLPEVSFNAKIPG